MQISAKELSILLNGIVEGNPGVLVNRPARIEEATEGSISFLGNAKYESDAYTTQASILLVHKDFHPKQPIASTLIRVDDVYAAIAFLLEKFAQKSTAQAVISDKASIHSGAVIGEGVSIGDFAVIEEGCVVGNNTVVFPQVYVGANVQLGELVTLYPGVRIYNDCTIGDRCVIHANAVIGSDGFGFAPQADKQYKKIPQLGNVRIESDVEIGANTVIDRATMGSTIIRKGVKLDNLIQIGHNVEVGENTVIAAQAGISGSTKIGKNVMIGGQAGFAGHISIADEVRIQAQSGVASNIEEKGTSYYGSPAIPHILYLRAYAVFKNLPEIVKMMPK